MWDFVLNVCFLGYYVLWIILMFGYFMIDLSRCECLNCFFFFGEGYYIDV